MVYFPKKTYNCLVWVCSMRIPGSRNGLYHILGHIYVGIVPDIWPLHRPYGRYLQFRFLKWPFMCGVCVCWPTKCWVLDECYLYICGGVLKVDMDIRMGYLVVS